MVASAEISRPKSVPPVTEPQRRGRDRIVQTGTDAPRPGVGRLPGAGPIAHREVGAYRQPCREQQQEQQDQRGERIAGERQLAAVAADRRRCAARAALNDVPALVVLALVVAGVVAAAGVRLVAATAAV